MYNASRHSKTGNSPSSLVALVSPHSSAKTSKGEFTLQFFWIRMIKLWVYFPSELVLRIHLVLIQAINNTQPLNLICWQRINSFSETRLCLVFREPWHEHWETVALGLFGYRIKMPVEIQKPYRVSKIICQISHEAHRVDHAGRRQTKAGTRQPAAFRQTNYCKSVDG